MANSITASMQRTTGSTTHLKRLESESIHILREVAAEFDNPAILYSIGKDSSVILHLARKAFFPSKPPMPLVHIDSTWEFREVIEFREQYARRELGLKVIAHVNDQGVRDGINPFDHGRNYTDIMRTQPLKAALNYYKFDAAIGGGRRDEEKSRAKERVFSFRDPNHRWDPRNQRPELWNLFNTWKHAGESMRVFPLSNWTELDVWQYIMLEQVPIVPLYFAKERDVVRRGEDLIVVDDERMRLEPDERPERMKVRFRTLGCYPVTGAIKSNAETIEDIVEEMLTTRISERQGRAIDREESAAMERKKREGYF
ncbi:Sulfate adenylyltransferase subunit 2 [Roseimaritima multifibrata]|uniref:Sulfate adenylyltransferase subunit 2 n=1 Tax=Roseimaritima multifibrata TaxID=1930274 RepID=A0A517M9G4_9BACT|nr:sulfate adenylyltransferase subunit CysD [Roseimaritima multifibrata]QDS91519.1 Sulfate adenylyltransferase subunit 2 [Roseimaritima multifibrata]